MTKYGIIILASLFFIFSCKNEVATKEVIISDFTKKHEIPLSGLRGDKIRFTVTGKIDGSVKMALIATGNEATPEAYSEFSDSVNFDIGEYSIYQDSTGLKLSILPSEVKSGELQVRFSKKTSN